MALPHPEPRRDGHDAAGDRFTWRGRSPTRRCSRSHWAASSSTGPMARRSTIWIPRPGATPRTRSASGSNEPSARDLMKCSATTLANVTTFTDPVDITTITQAYNYRVVAFNAAGNSLSNVIAFLPPAPVAPTNMTAGAASAPLRIGLSWMDNSLDETSFLIERSVDGAPFAFFFTFGPRAGTGTRYYTNSTISIGHTYAYRVAAVGMGGTSAFATSPTVDLLIPAAPSNALVTAVQNGTSDRVTLTWTDNSNNETSFRIQRASDANFNVNMIQVNVGANLTSFSHTAPRFTTYYYRIQAFNRITGASVWVNFTPFPIVTP